MLSKDRGLEDPEFGKSKGKGTEMELGMMCAWGHGGGSEPVVGLRSVSMIVGKGETKDTQRLHGDSLPWFIVENYGYLIDYWYWESTNF